MTRIRHQTRKKNKTVKMVLYFLVLVILCACIAGLWFRQKERQANFHEMVSQVSQMETEYHLQRYGSDETEESLKNTETESESNSK